MENDIESTLTKSYPWLLQHKYSNESESYPKELMDKLKHSDLMTLNVPKKYGGLNSENGGDNSLILNVLKLLGACDLSVGRIFEGHVNAMLLIDKFGTESQKEHYFSEAKSGILFGIWNSEHPAEPLELIASKDRMLLNGSKVFCSGANNVFRPIVTAQGQDGQQMLILHLDEYHLKEDFTYWQPMGMISSVSCRFDFSGIEIEKEQHLGELFSYYNEPDFSGGSVRFAAVQLGGASACISATINHLKSMNRTEDSNQVRRIAELSILLKTGELWLEAAAEAYDERYQNPANCTYLANMFRTVVRDLCEKVLSLCEMSVGLQGFLKPHPIERIHRDLSVYLKQPAPDKSLSEVGKHFITNYADEKE